MWISSNLSEPIWKARIPQQAQPRSIAFLSDVAWNLSTMAPRSLEFKLAAISSWRRRMASCWTSAEACGWSWFVEANRLWPEFAAIARRATVGSRSNSFKSSPEGIPFDSRLNDIEVGKHALEETGAVTVRISISRTSSSWNKIINHVNYTGHSLNV